MTEKQYKIHQKEALRINRRIWFRLKFDPAEIVASSFVLLSERGEQYNPETFYKMIYRVMSNENMHVIKSNPLFYKNTLERQSDFKRRNREKVGNWYVKHLLSKKHSMDYIKLHPDLVEQKRQEILNLRKNNNQPIENTIPILPPELMDLASIETDYKGYAITKKGDLYSCKTLFKTDVMFTSQWRPITRRKNGCIRLNIKGVKKELSINYILKKL